MSGIVLSSSVRQNLLSLQSTADLLATTQNRLSTGKKVNTALDNPTNFFTASKLDSRAGDINNLLDGIGNGVQVLQAANTGITSLQKLVDTAKSIANQALQTSVGYSTKSNVSATIAGATAADLRGTTTYSNASAVIQRAVSTAPPAAPRRLPALDARRHCRFRWSLRLPSATTGTRRRITAATKLYRRGRAGVAGLTTQATTAFQRRRPSSTSTATPSPSRPALLLRPPACSLPATASVGNIVTDGSGNSTVYLGDHRNRTRPRLSATCPPRSTLPAAPSTPSVSAGAATIATNTGQTASSIAAGIVTLKARPAPISRSPARPTPQGAEADHGRPVPATRR